MKIALVGNNDGPLRFYNQLVKTEVQILYVGLQNRPEDTSLENSYKGLDVPVSYDIDEQKMLEDLLNIEPDIIINIFCNFIFKKSLLYYTILNYHLSPLPRYRGRHPMHWALINGEKTFGSTVHFMNEKIDDGAIVLESTLNVPDRCSVQNLRELLICDMETKLHTLPKLLIDPTHDFKINDISEATYVLRRFPEDSQLKEWDEPERIYRKIWALSSESNAAYLMIKEKRYEVKSARFEKKQFEGVSTPTIYKVDKKHIYVATKSGLSLILKLDNHDLKPNTKIDFR
ncbi:MAG: formyltransferase family protein [Nonlabens sp.]